MSRTGNCYDFEVRHVTMIGVACFLISGGCGSVKALESDGGALDGGVSDDAGGNADAAEVDAGPLCPIGAICEANVNYAFVTSTTVAPGALGGLEQGDTLCNTLAGQAGLPGQYRAWLSTMSVDARDRLGSANGWIRPDRRPFAISRDALLAGEVIHPLNLNENGFETANTVPTATDDKGERSGDTCGDWTDLSGTVGNGLSNSADADWTQNRTSLCETLQPLYCFGIDHNNPLTAPVASGRLAWVSKARGGADFTLAAMDDACDSEGLEQGVASSLAFVAASNQSAISRFDENGTTWVRADGTVLWEQASDVAVKEGPLAPIRVHADGTLPAIAIGVWGGAMGPDSIANTNGIDNCLEWTFSGFSTSIRGLRGYSNINGAGFFNESPTNCGELARFYCFEE